MDSSKLPRKHHDQQAFPHSVGVKQSKKNIHKTSLYFGDKYNFKCVINSPTEPMDHLQHKINKLPEDVLKHIRKLTHDKGNHNKMSSDTENHNSDSKLTRLSDNHNLINKSIEKNKRNLDNKLHKGLEKKQSKNRRTLCVFKSEKEDSKVKLQLDRHLLKSEGKGICLSLKESSCNLRANYINWLISENKFFNNNQLNEFPYNNTMKGKFKNKKTSYAFGNIDYKNKKPYNERFKAMSKNSEKFCCHPLKKNNCNKNRRTNYVKSGSKLFQDIKISKSYSLEKLLQIKWLISVENMIQNKNNPLKTVSANELLSRYKEKDYSRKYKRGSFKLDTFFFEDLNRKASNRKWLRNGNTTDKKTKLINKNTKVKNKAESINLNNDIKDVNFSNSSDKFTTNYSHKDIQSWNISVADTNINYSTNSLDDVCFPNLNLFKSPSDEMNRNKSNRPHEDTANYKYTQKHCNSIKNELNINCPTKSETKLKINKKGFTNQLNCVVNKPVKDEEAVLYNNKQLKISNNDKKNKIKIYEEDYDFEKDKYGNSKFECAEQLKINDEKRIQMLYSNENAISNSMYTIYSDSNGTINKLSNDELNKGGYLNSNSSDFENVRSVNTNKTVRGIIVKEKAEKENRLANGDTGIHYGIPPFTYLQSDNSQWITFGGHKGQYDTNILTVEKQDNTVDSWTTTKTNSNTTIMSSIDNEEMSFSGQSNNGELLSQKHKYLTDNYTIGTQKNVVNDLLNETNLNIRTSKYELNEESKPINEHFEDPKITSIYNTNEGLEHNSFELTEDLLKKFKTNILLGMVDLETIFEKNKNRQIFYDYYKKEQLYIDELVNVEYNLNNSNEDSYSQSYLLSENYICLQYALEKLKTTVDEFLKAISQTYNTTNKETLIKYNYSKHIIKTKEVGIMTENSTNSKTYSSNKTMDERSGLKRILEKETQCCFSENNPSTKLKSMFKLKRMNKKKLSKNEGSAQEYEHDNIKSKTKHCVIL